MKNIFKIAIVLTLAITIYSCSDSYYDTNTPSNAVAPESVAINNILPSAIQATMSAQYSAAVSLAQVDQHIASAFNDQNIDKHYQNSLDEYWRLVYSKALPNIKVLEDKATATNSSHYLAIAKVLKAINIGLTTDLHGDVPYIEATLAATNFYPKYDAQQIIYTDVIKLLDDAIVLFSTPNTSIFTPGADDLIYSGKAASWTKVAYTFKARFQLHLMKVNGATTTASAVLSSLSKGFTANSDDFQLKYNSINTNPWYQSQLGLSTGNLTFYISNHFISYMNGGAVFPFASSSVTMDPRMPLLVDLSTYSSAGITPGPDPTLVANYIGSTNGTATTSKTKIGTQFFYSKIDSPIVYLTYAEAKFMEAEAQFLLAGGTPTSTGTNSASYTAYLAGIGANMDKIGVAATNKNNYLADASIAKGAAAIQLKDIMRQKFIALFLNPETFTDYRRYDFSTNAFKNLTIPANTDPLNGGKWIRRFVYSNNEKSANTANYNLNFKSMITPVWWDN